MRKLHGPRTLQANGHSHESCAECKKKHGSSVAGFAGGPWVSRGVGGGAVEWDQQM